MTRRFLRTAILVASVVAAVGVTARMPVTAAPAAPHTAKPAALPSARDVIAPSDRFIVRFRSDALERGNPVARRQVLDNLGRKLGMKVSHGRRLGNGADLVRTDRKLDRAQAKRLVIALRSDPRVEYVEVDRLHKPLFTPTADPLWPQQAPYLAKGTGIGVDVAWDRDVTFDGGHGTVVAVVDTGITSHPDLNANVLAGYDFITDAALANDGDGRDANAADPGDWVASNECGVNSAANSSWHGTEVAGVIAADIGNSIGLVGVAYDTRIVPVRALGKCGGYTSDIADGIVWAAGSPVAGVPANANPADVINLSFTAAGTCSQTTQDAINTANLAGAVVVAAVGTNPASCTGVIGVTVANHFYSNPSPYADIAAPAGQPPFADTFYEPFFPGVWTTSNDGTTAPGAASYAEVDTFQPSASLPTAITSGVVALMQSLSPQTPTTVEALLRATAVAPRIECETSCEATQYPGLLDADAATLAATTPVLVVNGWRNADETDTSRTFPVVVTLTRPLQNAVTFTAASTDGDAVAGSDYTALAPTVFTIPAGQTSKVIDLTLLGDDLGEMREDFWLDISGVTGTTDLTDRVRVWILDDDARWLDYNYQDDDSFNPDLRLAAADGAQQRFVFRAPVGATNVQVLLGGNGTGETDLYVRAGSAPTVSTYDCASVGVGDIQQCNLGNVSGLYFILVDGVTDDDETIRVRWDTEPSTISIADAQVVEGNTGYSELVFRIERSGAADVKTVAYYQLEVVAGTATYFVDYGNCNLADGSTAHFLPNNSAHECRVSVNGDFDVESNETIIANLINVTGASVGDGSATGTILNDDGPTLSIGDKFAQESYRGRFTVTLSEPAVVPVTFDFTTSDGTATAGSDYTPVTGSRTIPAGSLTESLIDVWSLSDTNAEADETAFVTISNASGASIQRDRATFEIRNDDTFVSIGNASVTEGNSGTRTATLVISLSKATPAPVSVDVRVGSSSSAAAGIDYLKQWQRVTIPAGMTSKLFPVAVLGDTIRETNETFGAQLSNADGAYLGNSSGTVTINDDDPIPTLSIADASVNEGDSGTKNLTFVVSLSNATYTPVTFSATSVDGTATSPSDFTAIALTGQTIGAGGLVKNITMSINGDTTPEALEQFTVAIHSPTGAAILDNQGLGSIINNDGPTLSITDGLVTEGASGTKLMTFTVSLSQAAATDVTYRVYSQDYTATAGSDYVGFDLSGQTIPAGQLSKQHTVTINGDATVEGNEAFTVLVRQPTGASVWDGYGTGQILNDDGPTLSVPDVGVVEGDSGTKTINVTVKLSQAAAVPVTYSIASSNGSAVAGSDYTAINLTNQVIPAGELQKVHAITVSSDTLDENNETFTVTLTASGSAGATVYDGVATANIYNDDGPTLTVGDAAISEGQSGTKLLTFTVTLSQVQASTINYSIATSNVTATAGSDYVANTLAGEAIPAGQLSKTFAVAINGDAVVEPAETFRVTLSAATPGVTLLRPIGVGTITNDD